MASVPVWHELRHGVGVPHCVRVAAQARAARDAAAEHGGVAGVTPQALREHNVRRCVLPDLHQPNALFAELSSERQGLCIELWRVGLLLVRVGARARRRDALPPERFESFGRLVSVRVAGWVRRVVRRVALAAASFGPVGADPGRREARKRENKLRRPSSLT